MSKPSGITLKHKFTIGFGGLLLLMVVSLGLTLKEIKKVEKEANVVIEQHQPSAVLLLRLSEEINLVTNYLNAFLLTGQEEYKKNYLSLEQSIREQVTQIRFLDIQDTDALSNDDIAELEDYLKILLDYGSELLELRMNNDENYPGLKRATEILNPPALAYLGLINEMAVEDIGVDDPEQRREIVSTLYDLRYSWAQMMNSMRLFLNQGAKRDLDNFNNYVELNGDLHKRLDAFEVEIGLDAPSELRKIRTTYLAGVPEIIELRNGEIWRMDIFLMNNVVGPLVGQIRPLLDGLVKRQITASQDSGSSLTRNMKRTSIFTVSVLMIVLIAGITLSFIIIRGVIPPVLRLVDAARQIAHGDLNAEVIVKSKDEIGLLGNSFNAMVYDLRIAEINKQNYMEQLEQLNKDLEDRVVERTTELEKSEAKIRAVLDNMGEGILVINEGGFIESCNPAARKIFGMEGYNINGLHSSQLIAGKVNMPDVSAEDEVADVNDDISSEIFRVAEADQPVEFEGKGIDGRVFPMEMVVTLMTVGEQRLRAAIVRDITQRKETDQRLREAQNQLLDAAHKSGMAEMATGVLHNIGNILNTVNVSVEEISRVARSSKISGLEKANDMLRSNQDRITEFLTLDPKGRKLPDYYIKLGSIINEEITQIMDESRLLSEKVTMMKDVISTQQAYAHAGFFSEEFPVEPLIHDALKVQEASLHKWGVNVQTQFDSVPNIIGQKSKLLQVITNLIKNAKEAMFENDLYNKPKEMIISIGLYKGRSVYVSVKDNGCGISEENLSKVFNHGFTTKESGHGFGLHASANALTEMGGALTVSSDGEHQGSIFTLSIPVANSTNLKVAAN